MNTYFAEVSHLNQTVNTQNMHFPLKFLLVVQCKWVLYHCSSFVLSHCVEAHVILRYKTLQRC